MRTLQWVGRPGAACSLLVSALGCGNDGTTQKIGEVYVFERNTGMEQTIAVAGFEQRTILSTRSDGPCRIEQRAEGKPSQENAGTVTIAGGTGGDVVLAPDSRNSYGTTFESLRYAANTVLTVSSTGGTVPAFSGSVSFPAVLTLAGAPPAAVNVSGFTAAWAPTSGMVWITIREYPMGAPQTHVECTYSGSDGMAAISTSALSDLATGTTAFVAIGTDSVLSTPAADYVVSIHALFQPFAASIPVEP